MTTLLKQNLQMSRALVEGSKEPMVDQTRTTELAVENAELKVKLEAANKELAKTSLLLE